MSKRKEIALNKLFNFCIAIGLFFIWFGISLYADSTAAWDLVISAFGLLFIVLAAIFTPYCYAFDSEGVSLCYLFLPVERYLWKDISAIDVYWRTCGSFYRKSIFDLLFDIVFSIDGENVGECRFYMSGYIRKSFRTKYLLEKYWDGTITGYLFEDTKKWLAERKAKKEKQIQVQLADEVVVMEREMRAEAREWMTPFIAQAKQRDLEIKTKYVYITKNLEELNSRPQESYTYTLIAAIARPNETDEDRIVLVSTNLLNVRLGKTAYRGVKNPNAKEEIQYYIADVLDSGIEAFCKNAQ
jgi:hypothetical protein